MAKDKKLYQPTVRNCASICNWNLSFRFYTREQAQKFINLYLNEFESADNISYTLIAGDSLTKDEHWVNIEHMSWANNLTRVGKLLEKCDYQMQD